MSTLSPDVPPHARIQVALRGRRRISLTLLAKLAGLTTRALQAALEVPPMAKWLRKRGFALTDSKALGLQPLERWPYSIPYLIR